MYLFLKNIIRLIRVKHWIKNTFIFLPIFFAGKITLIFSDNLLFLFFSFCLASSSIYVLNDIFDVDKDRLHPSKKGRPIASGFFSIKVGFLIFAIVSILFLASLIFIKESFLYVLLYFVLNVLYSFKLKHISIVDVACISIGFVLRVLAGGYQADVHVSHWMIIMIFLLTISLAFAKRRDDLDLGIEKETLRKSLSGYTFQFLDVVKSISFSITLISYVLYSISPEVIERIGSDKLYITSLFVFLGIMRYLQISIVDKNTGSPVQVLMKDRFIQITLLLWGLTFFYIIYGKSF